MRSVTASKPCTRAVCSETGRPHAFSAVYASCSVFGLKPSSVAETGGAVAGIGERRLALGNQTGVQLLEVGHPEEHLAAPSNTRGTGKPLEPVSRSGTSSMVREFNVTSSPGRPSGAGRPARAPPRRS